MDLLAWFKRKDGPRAVENQLPTLAAPAVQVEVAAPAPEEPQYIMTDDGNVTVRWHGKTHAIGKTHRNYDTIVAALLNKESNRLDMLLDVAAAIQKAVAGVTVNEYGEVFYGGQQVHGVVADKISEFIRTKQPYKPLILFLGNLMQNPSEKSREQLYNFLMHGGFPVTHDGCFLAYKGIRSDWKDKHTGTFDNSIGSVNEMERDLVDPDSSQACSTGFHVGTHSYATQFVSNGGLMVLVKVNPRDAVSVPTDHCCEKLRVCRYEVVEVCERKLDEPLYPAVQPSVDDEDDEDDDEYEDDEEDGYDYEDDEPVDDGTPWAELPTDAATTVKTPKRAACIYCDAKGGKKHASKCKRPKQ